MSARQGRGLRRIAFGAAVMTAVGALTAGAAQAADPVGASATMARTWGVDGHVAALAVAGDTVVVAGDFDMTIGPSGDEHVVTNLARYRPATGTFDPWPVVVDGPVGAVAVAGDTVYLAGDFRHVDGALRVSLAAVSLSTGAVLPWAPQANISAEAIAAVGSYVYIGGAFTTVTDGTGSVDAAHLARIGVDGTVDRPWSTALTLDDRVRTIVPKADGSAVYVGGDFGAIGSATYAARLALITTGPVASVDPTFRMGPNNNGGRAPVFGVALQGNALLIAAGGGGGGCTLQDATTGATQWSYHTNGNVAAAAFLGPMSYCGGHFSGSGSFNLLTRKKIAEVVTATGQITAWAPNVNSNLGIWALVSTGSALVTGGDFTKVGPTPQQHVGMFADRSLVGAPAVPHNLAARAGDHQVVLSWDYPDTDGGAKISKFAIYRSRGGGSSSLLAKTANPSYVDTTVQNGILGDPNTAYAYTVRALNAAGTGPATGQVQALPLAGQLITPSAPESFVATGDLGVASLSWTVPLSDGGSPITGYTILRGTASGVLAPYDTVPPQATSYTDHNAMLGTRYFYAVAATNLLGPGVQSKEGTATPDTGVPAAPVLIGVSAGGAAHLSWTAPDDGGSPITKYVLTRDGVRVFTGDASQRSFVDSGVKTGQTYAYKVKAVNGYGASHYSDVVSITI